VTFLQRTFTSLVHAHAGRTQGVQHGLRNAVTFFAKTREKVAIITTPVNAALSVKECIVNIILKWLIIGASFGVSLFSIGFVYEHHINPLFLDEQLYKPEINEYLQIVKTEPLLTAEHPTVNLQIKNTSPYKFTFVRLRVELYDENGVFIMPCQKVEHLIPQNSDLWAQIICGNPKEKNTIVYSSIKASIMSAKRLR
jgi:hypothetical protein